EAERSAREHGRREDDKEGAPRRVGEAEERGGVNAGHRTDHVDVAVGEVDEAEDAVDHRVPDGDERVYRAPTQAVDDLLEELADLVGRQVHSLPADRKGDRPESKDR